jgi:hypothetical protein
MGYGWLFIAWSAIGFGGRPNKPFHLMPGLAPGGSFGPPQANGQRLRRGVEMPIAPIERSR